MKDKPPTHRFAVAKPHEQSGNMVGRKPSPPPIPKRPHAPVDTGEIPIILEPKVHMKGAESQEGVQKGLREMDLGDVRALLRAAKVLGGEKNAERLAGMVTLILDRKEAGSPAHYMVIRTEDGQRWRLYEYAAGLCSTEKFELCDYVATLESEGRLFFLYRER